VAPLQKSATLWWRRNRDWARPVGFVALLLSALSIAGCFGTVVTLVYGAVRLAGSLRKE
jgi:membrane protein YqaA with SNARE-associated domain